MIQLSQIILILEVRRDTLTVCVGKKQKVLVRKPKGYYVKTENYTNIGMK